MTRLRRTPSTSRQSTAPVTRLDALQQRCERLSEDELTTTIVIPLLRVLGYSEEMSRRLLNLAERGGPAS